MEKPNKILLDVVAATLAGSFLHVLPMHYSPLVTLGYVEVNSAITDGKGFATRATESGIKFVQDHTTATQQNDTSSQIGNDAPLSASQFDIIKPLQTAKLSFVIEDGIPVPTEKPKRGGGTGNSIYPFDVLNVGQSFFVPDGEKKATKTMASTVTAANIRYSKEVVPAQTRVNRKGATVPVTYQEREFICRPVEGGARIWRLV